jgi:hypothetical protein
VLDSALYRLLLLYVSLACKAVEQQHCDRQEQHAYDDEIQPAPGNVSDGLGSVDVFFFLDALRR